MTAPANKTERKMSSEKNQKCISSEVTIGQWKTFMAIFCTLIATARTRVSKPTPTRY